MDGSPAIPDGTSRETGLDFDAIVIGAGVSGLYQLYRLRELGLKARVFETGSAVGGTGLMGSNPAQYLQLQQQMNMQQEAWETASAVMKCRHDASMSAIRNIS